MTMFRRELKNNVKNEMMRDERLIENLNIMIEMTIDLDDKLYERAMKRRHQDHRLSREESYVDHESHEYTNKKSSRQRQEQNSYEHTSMKLDIVKRKRSRVSDKRQERRKENKSCFICDKEDHFAKNCRSKNNMIRRQQINATLRRQSRAESKKD
jgi:Arc/MetJ family transcription regulator